MVCLATQPKSCSAFAGLASQYFLVTSNALSRVILGRLLSKSYSRVANGAAAFTKKSGTATDKPLDLFIASPICLIMDFEVISSAFFKKYVWLTAFWLSAAATN